MREYVNHEKKSNILDGVSPNSRNLSSHEVTPITRPGSSFPWYAYLKLKAKIFPQCWRWPNIETISYNYNIWRNHAALLGIVFACIQIIYKYIVGEWVNAVLLRFLHYVQYRTVLTTNSPISTAHLMLLNSLEHWICTTTLIDSRPCR